jgi:membrane-associated protease RseP (regulator of RpoE activity)
MPNLPSSSIASPVPFASRDAADDEGTPHPPDGQLRWRIPLALFVATVLSILYTAAATVPTPDGEVHLRDGVSFAVALLAILLTHEFAHYGFARRHRVSASLPMFLPLPLLGFGTLGAVILMRDRIKAKNALVDIGASGPLAGMLVAVPVLLYGLAHSEVHPLEAHGEQEGQSLVYWLLKRIALGPIPDGWDVYLSPVARAGWVGLFITMLNLLPVGQLDGGHVAYALLGPRQNRYSTIVRWSLLALAPINIAWRLLGGGVAGSGDNTLPGALLSGAPWVTWFILLTVLGRFSRGGHPPTEPGELSPGRRVVAVLTLLLFVGLFMPTPWTSY